jgi:hypothetical protein
MPLAVNMEADLAKITKCLGRSKSVHAKGNVRIGGRSSPPGKGRRIPLWRSRLRPAICSFAFPFAWT